MRAKIEENRLSSIDGVEFDLVTLVASVVSAENKSGTRSYSIEDGTGRIRARQWLPLDKNKDYIYDKPEDLLALASTYIRVYGKPSTYKGYISLEIQDTRPVTDPHEIYFHIMESIVATLQYTRGPPVRLGIRILFSCRNRIIYMPASDFFRLSSLCIYIARNI